MGDAGGAGGNNMNIKQAKNEVKNTVKAYLSKDATWRVRDTADQAETECS